MFNVSEEHYDTVFNSALNCLHRDLKIPTIRQEIQKFAERHERRLHNNVNTEVLQVLDNTSLNRRLKKINCLNCVVHSDSEKAEQVPPFVLN
jgi:hypothetical protein